MKPLNHEKTLSPAPISAALGMAAAYYTFPLFNSLSNGHLFLAGLLFLFFVPVSILRVLRFPFSEILPQENNAVIHKLGILVLALVVGFSLGIAARQSNRASPEMGLEPEKVIAVSGILREDPRSLHGGSGLGILELRQCRGGGGIRASSRGRLSVFFPADSIPGVKEFGRGSEIYAEGTLSRGSRGFVFNARSVHIVKPAPPLETFRTGLRLTLLEKFQSRQGSTAPVWGAFASAMLLGMRDDLDVDLAEGFRNSGCGYILALSGMHLAILSGALAFMIRRPLGIRWASLVGALFIVFYVFLAGTQASLIRSAIMYMIGVFAVWGFLKKEPLSLLCMAFVIQLIFQSETGLSLSFIFSYLALCGILTLGETLRVLFRGRLPEIFNRGLSASLGAFIFTAPVVILYFGSLRPIGILAGPIVAAVSSVFMILALAALSVSFLPFPLWNFLGNFLDFILTQVYRVIEFTVFMAGQVPGVSGVSPLAVLVFSIVLCLFILFLQKLDFSYRSKIASLY